MVSKIGEMTVLLGFPGQKFSRNEIIFFAYTENDMQQRGQNKKKPYAANHVTSA